MKTLLLLRHAKSDWADAATDDHDRPLAPRGERACAKLAVFLASRERPPELALCSTARRAVDTFRGVVTGLTPPPELRLDRRLYLASPAELIERLSWVEPDVESVLVVAHNPGLHDLALLLAGHGKGKVLEHLGHKFPTGALAELRLDVDGWTALGPRCAELVAFVTPKGLPDA